MSSLRKRRSDVLECKKDEANPTSTLEDICDVHVLPSVDHSNDIMEEDPREAAISVSSVKEKGGVCCDKKPSKKLHRKMKKDSSSKNSITSSLRKVLWPRAPLSSALRLGLSVLVIITFIFGLTQLQNVEGQLDNQDSVHQKKMPNDQ